MFDLVVCLDVFEHIEDYFGFLRSLWPRGRRHVFNIPLDMNALKVATGMSDARKQFGHLHYFDAFTASETLRDTGYTVLDSFLANATRASMPRNIKQAMVAGPRLLTSAILGDRLTARLSGGYSLVVLAE